MPRSNIQDQLDALRGEVRSLSDSLVSLRQDDLRKVFGGQIRSVLLERIERAFAGSDADPSTDRSEQKAALVGLVDRVVSAFIYEDKDAALRVLDEQARDVERTYPSVKGSAASRSLADVVQQLHSYLDTYNYITGPTALGIGPAVQGTRQEKERSLSPTVAEKLLGPLANAWRIDILLRLSREHDSLTRLSRATGLKKGHLQFHLNTLLEADYVQYDRKSRLYAITRRGSLALDGLERLVESVQLKD